MDLFWFGFLLAVFIALVSYASWAVVNLIGARRVIRALRSDREKLEARLRVFELEYQDD